MGSWGPHGVGGLDGLGMVIMLCRTPMSAGKYWLECPKTHFHNAKLQSYLFGFIFSMRDKQFFIVKYDLQVFVFIEKNKILI